MANIYNYEDVVDLIVFTHCMALCKLIKIRKESNQRIIIIRIIKCTTTNSSKN
jgi:hypothetical protein